MNQTDIAAARLAGQQIAGTELKTIKDIVSWMGAMQAQDYSMMKWAIGIRLPGSTQKNIDAALDCGEIIRTHLLRPTWHVVSADDIRWMLALTAPRIRASMKSRHKQLEITDPVVTKSNAVIEKALAAEGHLTRDELLAGLEKAKIATGGQRGAHLLFLAELDGIICSGAAKGKQTTYALLEERAPKTNVLSRDEALAELARRYFTSHGPATLQDFVWWSGLSVADAKQALEMLRQDLVSGQAGMQTYWWGNLLSLPATDWKSLYLLPAFDEFIISYKDRSAVLPAENHRKAVSNNGIFWPTVVVKGRVAGTWKRAVKNDKVIVETRFFEGRRGKVTERSIQKASARFGHFLGKEAVVTQPPQT